VVLFRPLPEQKTEYLQLNIHNLKPNIEKLKM